jgi:putative acetyltransferase
MTHAGERASLLVRPETAADHVAIRAVVMGAFASDTEADLVDAIRTSAEYVAAWALVAVDHAGDVAGHVMVSYASLVGESGSTRPIAMLSPLAVRPDVQGIGYGSALVRSVVELADAAGEPLVILEGNPLYYSRFGFEHARPLGVELPLPSWAMSEAGQLIRLAAYDGAIRGKVAYPPAFDGVTEH